MVIDPANMRNIILLEMPVPEWDQEMEISHYPDPDGTKYGGTYTSLVWTVTSTAKKRKAKTLPKLFCVVCYQIMR